MGPPRREELAKFIVERPDISLGLLNELLAIRIILLPSLYEMVEVPT